MDDIPSQNNKLPNHFVVLLLAMVVILGGLFIYAFKPIEKEIIVNKPTPTPTSTPTLSLTQLITNRDRTGIQSWAKNKSIAEINASVSQLTTEERADLASSVLVIKGDSSQAVKEVSRNKLLSILKQVLNKKDLGFYAEIVSYTTYFIEGGAFTGTCKEVTLSPLFNQYDFDLARDFFMHETLHSFNCVNNITGVGHSSALDEGSAIWIFKTTFPEGRDPEEIKIGWADAVYGTVNYYRDIGLVGYPRDIPLLAATDGTQKLKDVFNWLSLSDPSKISWDSQSKLTLCYDRYYKNLNRNVDYKLWLKKGLPQSQKMAKDTECSN